MIIKEEPDGKQQSLVEHLDELRKRLLISLVAVTVLTGICLYFADEILEYSVRPLREALRERSRIESVLVYPKTEDRARVETLIQEHPRVRFRATHDGLGSAARFVRQSAAAKRPIDLVFVGATAIGDQGTLMSDLLDTVEPGPDVVYLVRGPKEPIVAELQLEGVRLLLDPPSKSALNRVIRRAAAAAGKAKSGDLVVLSPLEPFFAYLKIALVCGLFLACPFWLYQAWMFIAPGLYGHEKRVALPAVLGASVLFMSGGLFAYYGMFPLMFDVLVNQMMPSTLTASFTVDNYLSLLLRMTVAFGAVFELPLILTALAAVGVVTADGLAKFRKIAIVIAFVLGAFLTPADPVSQIMMALPLVIFYEVGVLAARAMERRRAAEDAKLSDDDDG